MKGGAWPGAAGCQGVGAEFPGKPRTQESDGPEPGGRLCWEAEPTHGGSTPRGPGPAALCLSFLFY